MVPQYSIASAERHEAIAAELVRQMSHTYRTSHVAHAAVEELVRAHRLGAELYETTLARAAAVIQDAVQNSSLTPLQQAALDHYQQAYQYELLALVEAHGDAVIEILAQVLDQSGEHYGTW